MDYIVIGGIALGIFTVGCAFIYALKTNYFKQMVEEVHVDNSAKADIKFNFSSENALLFVCFTVVLITCLLLMTKCDAHNNDAKLEFKKMEYEHKRHTNQADTILIIN